jgi:hypothetical protein
LQLRAPGPWRVIAELHEVERWFVAGLRVADAERSLTVAALRDILQTMASISRFDGARAQFDRLGVE